MIKIANFLIKSEKIQMEHDLNIQASKYGVEQNEIPRLNVLAGIKMQEYIKKQKGWSSGLDVSKFNFELHGDNIYFVFTPKGRFTVRVRMKSDPNCLESLIKGVKEGLLYYLEKLHKQ